jgi:hypothetical protein
MVTWQLPVRTRPEHSKTTIFFSIFSRACLCLTSEASQPVSVAGLVSDIANLGPRGYQECTRLLAQSPYPPCNRLSFITIWRMPSCFLKSPGVIALR